MFSLSQNYLCLPSGADTQQNDNQNNGTDHNETQHNVTQHNGLICDTWHYDTQPKSIEFLYAKCHCVECRIFVVLLSVIMLSVITLNAAMLSVVI
jgi:hypothetical protein